MNSAPDRRSRGGSPAQASSTAMAGRRTPRVGLATPVASGQTQAPEAQTGIPRAVTGAGPLNLRQTLDPAAARCP
jgi:hypothetical protein